jgi:hypothetical protein
MAAASPANSDRAYGFKPYGPIGRVQHLGVLSGYGTAIFVNDLVSATSGGGIQASAASDNLVIRGVALTGSAASTAGDIAVLTDGTQMYQAQEDSDSATLALTDRGATTDHVAGAGSSTTGLSGHELDSSAADASGDDQILIVDLLNRSDNKVGDQAEWVVELVGHITNGQVGV